MTLYVVVVKKAFNSTLEYLINREKLIAVHNMEHPQKLNSQEANNRLFLDIFIYFKSQEANNCPSFDICFFKKVESNNH